MLDLEFFETFKFSISFFLLSCLICLLGFTFNFFYFSPNFEKSMAYERGFDCFFFNSNFKNFELEFFIIAIFFLIFDLELMLLVPWVVSFSLIGIEGCFVVYIFVGLLFIGFLIEYLRGVLHLNLAESLH